MDEYKVTVPLEGFRVIVKVQATNPRDAKSNALSAVMYQFPLLVNHSEEFELDGFVVGRVSKVQKSQSNTP